VARRGSDDTSVCCSPVLQTLMDAAAAGPNVGLMTLTVSSRAGGDWQQPLQTGHTSR